MTRTVAEPGEESPATTHASTSPEADLRALHRGYGTEYDITLIGLTWYAWRRDGTRLSAIRAGTAAGLRQLIGMDLRHRAPQRATA